MHQPDPDEASPPRVVDPQQIEQRGYPQHDGEGVVGVQPGDRGDDDNCRGRGREGDRLAGAIGGQDNRFVHDEAHQAVEQQRRQGGQLFIHARFLAVGDQEGVDGGKQGGNQRGPLVEQPAGDLIDQPHQQQPPQRRQRAHGDFTIAKDLRPQAEQPIIKRRVDISRRACRDLRQAALGHGDAVAFVGPQALRADSEETQHGCEQQDEPQEGCGDLVAATRRGRIHRLAV